MNRYPRILFPLFLSVALVSSVFSALAQDPEKDLKERIRTLEQALENYKQVMQAHEEQLKLLKDELEKQSAQMDQKVEAAIKKPENLEQLSRFLHRLRLTEKEVTPEEERLKTLYDEGFLLKGADDQLRIGGWLQVDSRWYLDDDHPESNTFLIRRARLDIRGILENDWAYRLYGTFIGQRNGILQEGWLEYRKYEGFRIRAGQTLEPFSLEALYSSRWIDFIERAMIVNALAPQEDIGIMAFGKIFEERVTWAFGFFNGQGRNRNAAVDDKDFTTRVVYSPFLHSTELPALRNLYLGGSFSTGNNERNFSGVSFDTQGFTPFYEFQPGAFQDDRLTRWGVEAEYLYGPFSLKSEYLSGHFQQIAGNDQSGELDVEGFYLNLAYILTGEDAIRDGPILPLEDFDLTRRRWGAWQLAARYQFLKTDRGLLDLGLAAGTSRAQSITLGLNWFPNRHVRLQFNFDHAWFEDEIVLEGVSLDSENTFVTRFQYDF